MAKRTKDARDANVGLGEGAIAADRTGPGHMRADELIEAISVATEIGSAETNAPNADADAVSLLSKDHAAVRALLKTALEEDLSDESLVAFVRKIVAKIELQTAVEEKVFYPALKAKAVAEHDEDAKEDVLEAYVEHASVKELIAKLKASGPSDESYRAMMHVLSERLDRHIEEERDMFGQAKTLLGQRRLDELGQQMLDMKDAAQGA